MRVSKEELPSGSKARAKPPVPTIDADTRQVSKANAAGVQQGRGTKVSPESGIDKAYRRQMIAEAAYYRYQNRGDDAGCDVDDWLAAEEEIDRLLDF